MFNTCSIKIKRMIYTLTVTIILFLSIFVLSINGGTATEIPLSSDKNFLYQVFSDKAYIVGYVGLEKEVTVPSEIDGYPVYHLEGLFNGDSQIEKVTISEGIETLEYCFRDCANLISVKFPGTLSHIDVHGEPDSDVIFKGCPKLNTVVFPKCTNKKAEGQYTFSSGVIYYEYGLLRSGKYSKKRVERYLQSNTEEIYEIPNDVLSIGMGCFAGCSNLKKIDIPKSVMSIGAYAFDRVTSITSINIPSSITYLAEGALVGLVNVKSFIIPDTVTNMEYSSRLFPVDAEVICYKYSSAWKMAKMFGNPRKLLTLGLSSIQKVKKNSKGIRIKCKVSTDANGVIVYRAVGGGGFKKISTIKGKGTVLYDDRNVKNKQKYRYCIKSFRIEKFGKLLSKPSKIKTIKK